MTSTTFNPDFKFNAALHHHVKWLYHNSAVLQKVQTNVVEMIVSGLKQVAVNHNGFMVIVAR